MFYLHVTLNPHIYYALSYACLNGSWYPILKASPSCASPPWFLTYAAWRVRAFRGHMWFPPRPGRSCRSCTPVTAPASSSRGTCESTPPPSLSRALSRALVSLARVLPSSISVGTCRARARACPCLFRLWASYLVALVSSHLIRLPFLPLSCFELPPAASTIALCILGSHASLALVLLFLGRSRVDGCMDQLRRHPTG